MKILLLGYGKMGKTVERLAAQKGHEVLYADSIEERNQIDIKGVEVAIEFSQPDAAYYNAVFCLSHNIPLVSGTTGWMERKQEIDELCDEEAGTFFYSSNFSIGVNLFFLLNEHFAKLMNDFGQYKVEMYETHHTEKKDSPSGTAITLANGIIENLDRKTGWSQEEDPSKVKINAEREGQNPGTHTVIYSSELDNIELKHTAHTRESFAIGALMVAEWIIGKKGVLTMKDYLNDR